LQAVRHGQFGQDRFQEFARRLREQLAADAPGDFLCCFRIMSNSLMPDRLADISQEQANALLSITRELLAIVSATGDFMFVNDGFARVLGYSPEDLVGKPLTWLHPSTEARSITEKLASIVAHDGATATCRSSLRSKSGQWRWFDGVAVNRLHDPNVRGILLSYQDVTEFHRMEAQRMVLSNVVHALNETSNPVSYTHLTLPTICSV